MKLERILRLAIALLIGAVCAGPGYGQTSVSEIDYNIEGANPIYTALPFLTIAPDSRSSGLGEAGVATTPDVWSIQWNAAKYAFIDKEMGAGISYVPWLRNLGVKDIGLTYGSGYYRIDKLQTVGAAVRYFSMGNIEFRDENGTYIGEFSPNEFTLDLAYARKLSENFSLSVGGRYINSNLTNGYSSDGSKVSAARTVAADVSGYYFNDAKINGLPAKYSLGFAVSNLGAKISYAQDGKKDFIPTEMRLGGGLALDMDAFNNIGLYADVKKLLVPTPPQKVTDSETGDRIIVEGKDNDVSMVTGVFQSFNDAPGGFEEEFHELRYSVGLEYWYDQQFALRGGYYTEHETKGNRKFFQLGLGLKMNVFGLDFSYLVPTKGQNSPLAKTFRFSLTFDFDGLSNEAGDEGI